MTKHHQRFSKSQLVYAYLPKYAGADKEPLEKAALSLSNDIFRGKFRFSPPTRGHVKGFDITRFATLRDNLVAEKINDNIKRSYSLNSQSRDRIISQVITFLGESYPKSITRLDIKSFFNSIDVNKAIRLLKKDGFVSVETLSLLQQQMEVLASHGVSGLPRGMSISSTLSEVIMSKVDLEIRSMKGVYYYGRYVDDIIIFSILDGECVQDKVKKILDNYGLNLSDKSNKKYFCNVKSGASGGFDFNYLGYRFVASFSSNSVVDLKVLLSEDKIKRIKTRLIKSLLSSGSTKDFSLLRDRVRFLAGHYPVYSKGKRVGSLRNGIGYSYSYITSDEQLDDLDLFKAKALHSVGSSFSRKSVSWMSKAERFELSRISFKKSFYSLRYYGFSASRMSQIMKIWGGE